MRDNPNKSEMEVGNINDKWLFVYVYPFLTLLGVHLGNDNGLLKLLGMPSYYTDILFALCCIYGCGLYIKRISMWICSRLGWEEKLAIVLRYQAILGLLVPILFVVFAELMYLNVLGIAIKDSSIFYLELPLTLLLCLLVNITYLFIFHQKHNLVVLQKTREIQKTGFLVKEGHNAHNVPLAEVAYFSIRNNFTFLVTKNGMDYLYDFPFKHILKKLPPNAFFQLNRQIISCRESIVRCTKTETRRLKIELFPKTDGPVYVAKANATKFLNWLDNP